VEVSVRSKRGDLLRPDRKRGTKRKNLWSWVKRKEGSITKATYFGMESTV